MKRFPTTFSKAVCPTRRWAGILLGLWLLAPAGGCGRSPYAFSQSESVFLHFSGEEAMRHTRNLVAMGPRVPGSEGAEKARVYIEGVLSQLGWATERQSFQANTPNGSINFANIRARFAGPARKASVWPGRPAVLIGSHYDTKFYREFTFLGANDSGSSSGALLEIARVTGEKPDLARRLELVFFDGEEAFLSSITPADGLYGSRHYQRVMRVNEMEGQRPHYGIILDMIGDRKLNIGVPSDSPPQLVDWLMRAATDLNVRRYFGRHRTPIIDDHLPLNEMGIPTIDIIDIDYDAWHTREDTLDRISAESIQIVGQTTLLMIEKYLVPSVEG